MSWGGPWSSPLRRIVIPGDAGPNDPRIVITSEPPAVSGYPINAAILFYWNATDFWYFGIAAIPAGGALVTGFVSETDGISDQSENWIYNDGLGVTELRQVVGDYLSFLFGVNWFQPTDALIYADGPIAVEAGNTATVDEDLQVTDTTTTAELVVTGGVYTSFTGVQLQGSGGATIGNATVEYRWYRIGKMVHAMGQIIFGNTTSAGTSTIFLTLPVAARSGTPSFIGSGYIFDAAPVARQQMSCILDSTTRFLMATAPGAIVSNTIPWTWTTSDQIRFNIMYESA